MSNEIYERITSDDAALLSVIADAELCYTDASAAEAAAESVKTTEAADEPDAVCAAAGETDGAVGCSDAENGENTDSAAYLEMIADLTKKLSAEREKNRIRELESAAERLLAETGLPAELKDVLVLAGDGARDTAEAILHAVRSAAESEIAKLCRTDTPESGVGAKLTKAELAKLPVAELQRLRDYGAAISV